MAKAFCESGLSRSDYLILDEMGWKGIKPDTFCNKLLLGFHQEERYYNGKVLEITMKNDSLPGFNPYSGKLQSLRKLRKTAEAMALLEGMLQWGMKSNTVTYYHL